MPTNDPENGAPALASAAHLLSSFGAIPDARMVNDAAMTQGSAVLASDSAGFTLDSVGRTVVVAGAGASGARLVTTILSWVSATEVILAAQAQATVSAGGAAWGTDCGAAFGDALAALDEAGGGELIVDGGFLLAQPAARHFVGALVTARSWIRIKGTGTDSFFVLALAESQDGLALIDVTFDLEDISFLGIPKAVVDAKRVIVLNGCTARISRCRFLGLSSADQIISSTSGSLRTKDCEFGGSFPQPDGLDPNITRSVIYNQDWIGYDDDSSHFVDYGFWRGMLLGKSGTALNTAWVAIRTPNPASATSAAPAAGVATFRHTRMDEGSAKGIWAQPETGIIPALHLFGTRQNISPAEGATCGVDASHVKNVRIDRSTFGWSVTNPTAFGRFTNCDVVEIDSVTLLQSVNRIVATNVGALIVRDTVIPSYQLLNTNYYPQDSRYGAFALRKNGAVADSDFPAPPGPGTQAIDTLNGRIYVRGGGGWFYAAFGGGDPLGPNLVVNGLFTDGTTTGWTASPNATLSVVGGALRVTNVSTYGYAYQVVPVEVGRTYRLDATIVGGNGGPMILAGHSMGGPTSYVNSTASGNWTFVATTTQVVIWFNLNTETPGRYGDFDNIGLRRA